ncbi:MAG: sodium/proton-translocating pyrophosphatase [bacterium]|nr:sodium/proton-translocating pyrophosphatase [bacterium]
MLYFPIVVSFFSLVFVFFLIRQVRKISAKADPKVGFFQNVWEETFLKREYRMIAVVAPLFFLILWTAFGFKSGLGFLVGVLAAVIVGLLGKAALYGSDFRGIETAGKSLKTSFKSSLALGLSVVGIGLLAVSVFCFFTHDLKVLVSLSLGGNLISAFGRIISGIYFGTVSIRKDLADNPEKETLEDNLKKTGAGSGINRSIAAAVDLFGTYVIVLVSAVILAETLFPGNASLAFLPILLAAITILAAVVGSFFVGFGENREIIGTFHKWLGVSIPIAAIGFYLAIRKIDLPASLPISGSGLYLASLAGLAVAVGIFIAAIYFASTKRKPVKTVASASQIGQDANIIVGLAVGIQSTIAPAALVFLGVFLSFLAAGIYGVALAAASVISWAAIAVSISVFCRLRDNFAGFSGTAETIEAMAGTYAVVSASLAALILFFAFNQELISSGARFQIFLDEPKIIAGLFLGSLLPCAFTFLLVSFIGRTAGKVTDEFKNFSYETKEQEKPEFRKLAEAIATVVFRQVPVFGLLPVFLPVAAGLIFGPLVLAGVLIGCLVAGLLLAISMILGGAVWNNARGYIEQGNYGGKGSPACQAAITGAAAGNFYKDAVGPALSSMIKIVNIVALLIVNFLV